MKHNYPKNRKKPPAFSEEHRRKLGLVWKGRKRVNSLETRKKMSLAKKGKPRSEEDRKHLSRYWKENANKKWNWKGGITPVNHKIRSSLEYRLWREAVFARDNWTCVMCLERGVKLEADHIKPFSLFPELRFAIDNGRTLCKPCHRKTPTWGTRKGKDAESFFEKL